MPLPVEELQKLATRYKADSESVYNTWFIDNEARLKPSTVPSIFSAFYIFRLLQRTTSAGGLDGPSFSPIETSKRSSTPLCRFQSLRG